MQSDSNISLQDRLAADVFQKSYREYLALKPTHYRWSTLAPQNIQYLDEAQAHHWSAEKVADYLNCTTDEALACQRRHRVSKNVNSLNSTAERIREAFFEWMGGVMDLDEKKKRSLAIELSAIVGNQLYVAALAKESLMNISTALEFSSAPTPDVKQAPPEDAGPRQWGPQWKS